MGSWVGGVEGVGHGALSDKSCCVDLFALVFCSPSSRCDRRHSVPGVLHGTEGETGGRARARVRQGPPNRASGSVVRNGNETIKAGSWVNVKKDEEIKGEGSNEEKNNHEEQRG